ncbi:recombinase family protein [Serratia marcescens]|nr:recombinase family protein [Serratia marcescens]
MKSKLFSYVRWSSDKQTGNTSLSRQSTKAREFADLHGLELVELLDAGLSAFRGKNTTQGALGGFIRAVESGAIPSNSWLYVENLDRLSRQDVLSANKLFSHLLELGLTVVTGMDGKIYTRRSVTDNPMDLMLSILLFSRANEESKTKQKRVQGHVRALVERHKAGEKVTIKIGAHPWWIDATGGPNEAVKPHPTLWQAARDVVRLYLDGWGAYRICDYLNETYPAPAQHSKGWSYQAINNMRSSRSLIGERVITLDKETHTLTGYYPALCSPLEFSQLQDRKENNKITTGEKKQRVALLSGMRILKCGLCGGPMTFFFNHGGIRYMCDNGKTKVGDCKAWSVRGDIVEHTAIYALLRGYVSLTLSGRAKGEDIQSKIESQQDALQAIESQLDNITNAITIGGNLGPLVERMTALEKSKQAALLELERLHQRELISGSQTSAVDKIAAMIATLTPDMLEDVAHPRRAELREIFRQVITRAEITKREDVSLMISFVLNGDTLYSFEGVKDGKGNKTYAEYITDLDDNGDPVQLPDSNEMRELIKQRELLEDQMFKLSENTLSALPAIDAGKLWAKR